MRARSAAWRSIALLIASLLTASALAQQLRRDVDYRLIPAQPVTSGTRVEVIEFFFYACPYCNEFEPYLENWLRNAPPDVVFRRVPLVRHDSWAPLAKVYYTLEAMGAMRLHGAVFHAYHVDALRLSDEDEAAEWAEKQGLDRKKFIAVYRSAEVRQKVEAASKMTLAYDIDSMPSIVVDGRFLTSSGMTHSVPGVIPVLDSLIRLARQQRAGQAGK